MERLPHTLAHEWHVAVNRRVDESRKAGEEWDDIRFMYEAKTMASEAAAAEAFGYEGGLQEVNLGDLLHFARVLEQRHGIGA